MNIYDEVCEAVEAIKARVAVAPKVGVVLGSGLGAFADRLSNATTIPYGQLPHFPVSAVEGHRGELIIGHIGETPVAVMSGRVHYYEGHSMARVTFPVRVLAALGATSLVVTNAAGAANPYFMPGDFMVIVDHINLTGDNPLRGPNDERLGTRFPDMTQAYDPRGRKALHAAAHVAGVSLHEGVYAGLSGPCYETPAEIRMLQTLGADAVGMSTVAEVIVAKQHAMCVAGLSVITNRAAGLAGEPLSHEEVKQVGAKVERVLCELLAETITQLGDD